MGGGESADAPAATEVDVFGLYCGGAFHELPFQRPGICGVRRVHDIDRAMLSVARGFLEVGAVSNMVNNMTIRAESVHELVADMESAAVASTWVHVNAGIPCGDGSKANPTGTTQTRRDTKTARCARRGAGRPFSKGGREKGRARTVVRTDYGRTFRK